MAKAKKPAKKKSKYDITVKPTMTADELFKKVINTPLKTSKAKKK